MIVLLKKFVLILVCIPILSGCSCSDEVTKSKPLEFTWAGEQHTITCEESSCMCNGKNYPSEAAAVRGITGKAKATRPNPERPNQSIALELTDQGYLYQGVYYASWYQIEFEFEYEYQQTFQYWVGTGSGKYKIDLVVAPKKSNGKAWDRDLKNNKPDPYLVPVPEWVTI